MNFKESISKSEIRLKFSYFHINFDVRKSLIFPILSTLPITSFYIIGRQNVEPIGLLVMVAELNKRLVYKGQGLIYIYEKY